MFCSLATSFVACRAGRLAPFLDSSDRMTCPVAEIIIRTVRQVYGFLRLWWVRGAGECVWQPCDKLCGMQSGPTRPILRQLASPDVPGHGKHHQNGAAGVWIFADVVGERGGRVCVAACRQALWHAERAESPDF